jgi:hypothetical protein
VRREDVEVDVGVWGFEKPVFEPIRFPDSED